MLYKNYFDHIEIIQKVWDIAEIKNIKAHDYIINMII